MTKRVFQNRRKITIEAEKPEKPTPSGSGSEGGSDFVNREFFPVLCVVGFVLLIFTLAAVLAG